MEKGPYLLHAQEGISSTELKRVAKERERPRSRREFFGTTTLPEIVDNGRNHQQPAENRHGEGEEEAHRGLQALLLFTVVPPEAKRKLRAGVFCLGAKVTFGRKPVLPLKKKRLLFAHINDLPSSQWELRAGEQGCVRDFCFHELVRPSPPPE